MSSFSGLVAPDGPNLMLQNLFMTFNKIKGFWRKNGKNKKLICRCTYYYFMDKYELLRLTKPPFQALVLRGPLVPYIGGLLT